MDRPVRVLVLVLVTLSGLVLNRGNQATLRRENGDLEDTEGKGAAWMPLHTYGLPSKGTYREITDE